MDKKYQMGLLAGSIVFGVGALITFVMVAASWSAKPSPDTSRAKGAAGKANDNARTILDESTADRRRMSSSEDDPLDAKPAAKSVESPPASRPVAQTPQEKAREESSLRITEWTHSEMIDRLKVKGLSFETTPSRRAGRGPCMYLVRKGDAPAQAIKLDTAPGFVFLAPTLWADTVLVQKRATAQSARDTAAVLRGLWDEKRFLDLSTEAQLRGIEEAPGLLNPMPSQDDSSQAPKAKRAPPAKNTKPITEIHGDSAFAWH